MSDAKTSSEEEDKEDVSIVMLAKEATEIEVLNEFRDATCDKEERVNVL